jgi:hypothetical protein
MNSSKKVFSLALALFINAGVITACTQQAPTTAGQPQNSVSSNNSGSVSAAITQEQIADASEVQSGLRDDELTVRDSETIASDDAAFSTKSNHVEIEASDVNDDSNNGKNGKNIKAAIEKEVKASKDNKGTAVKIEKAINNLGKNKRDEIVKDRLNVVKAKLDLLKSKLELKKDLKDQKKLDKLNRKNVDVKTSDVATTTNADGTTTKIMVIRFQNKNETNFRENKVVKTFAADGSLIKLEHYLTIELKEYSRTYTRIADFNADGSKKVVINSETKWPNGNTRVVSQEINVNADGSGTGTGTVTVTKDGKTTTYDINVSVTVSGDITVDPEPSSNPSPSPTASASPSASASASPTASATATAEPTATATATTEPTAEPTATATATAEPTAEPTATASAAE